MTYQLTILGCGSSGGVPRVGSGWGACDPSNPRNRRRRCAVLIERLGPNGNTVVLVDAGPDLREQLIGVGATRIDGVVLTHDHADHTHGIDDLRGMVLHMRRRIAVHMDDVTGHTVRSRFDYCFETQPGSDYPPILDEHRLVAGEPFTVDGPGGPIVIDTILVRHGNIDALGIIVGSMVYTPDLNHIPPLAVERIAGAKLWIVDALRHAPHPTHFCLREALEWIDRLKPQRAILTNLHTDLDYASLAASVPAHVDVAYDGMQCRFD